MLFCTTWLCAAVAFAAEFVVLEDECRGRQLLVTGVIEPGDAVRFAARLAALVNAPDLPAVQDPETLWTIKLDSPGGDVGEAIRIGRLVRAAVATTEASYRYARRADGVWDFEPVDTNICLESGSGPRECFADIAKAECAGACLLIWLAGAERYANEGRLGVHGLVRQAAPAAGDAAADAIAETEAVRAYLAGLGVAEEQVGEWLAPQVSGPRWLDWPARHALGGRSTDLVAGLERCPAALTPAESLDSVIHVDPLVRDRLMDRAAAHRACRLAVVAELRGDLPRRLAAGQTDAG